MNLNTTIDLDIKGFFQWWAKELAFLVPNRIRLAVRDRSGKLLFRPDAQGFLVDFLPDDDKATELHKLLDFADGEAYQRLLNENPGLEKTEQILYLNQNQALYKIIYLPAAAQENLQQVVSFELDRYTPFKPDQVYFSTVILGKTELGQLQVLLVVAPKNILDAQLDILHGWHAHPHRVAVQAGDGLPQGDDAYNLLPARYRQKVGKLEQSTHWLLTLLMALLISAVLVWPVWQQQQSVEMLKNAIKGLEKQTHIVEAQQKEIDDLHAETQKLIDLKQKAPALLPVLDELTKLLKDDTWLTHMQFSDQQMQIQGQSPAASALIGLLESSPYFSNVSFVSPLTQDKTTGRERFQISMTVEMPVPVADETSDANSDASAEDQQQETATGDAETDATDSSDTTSDGDTSNGGELQ